jgi:hypothetical protein
MPSVVKPEKGHEEGFTPMPDATISAIAAFVSGEGTDAERAKGKDAFNLACNGCHALDGDGGDDEPDVAPDLGAWGTLAWLRSQIANPAQGDTYKAGASDAANKGHMPAYETNADVKGDIDLMAQWVFAKAKGRAATETEIAAAKEAKASPAPTGTPTAPPIPTSTTTAPPTTTTTTSAAPSTSTSAAPSESVAPPN